MAPFGVGKDLAVLKSKLDIYEDLSKEMLDKLERAVTSISENSNRVAIILERHENRLDEVDKNSVALIKLIEKVEDKIDKVEYRVEQLSRFRWVSVGIATAAVILLRISDLLGGTPTMNQLPQTSLTGDWQPAIVR
jgi:septation ring formation regulator EzrA|tara:strand:+ start:631 stop:1038 length:408 start_codon:yes stop_codon:yes gene_type:complete